MSNNERHISSLLIQTQPNMHASVVSILRNTYEVETHTLPDNKVKIVVILETESVNNISDYIQTFDRIQGVLNVSMIYHQTSEANLLNEVIA